MERCIANFYLSKQKMKKIEDIIASLKRARNTRYDLTILTDLAELYRNINICNLLEYVPIKIMAHPTFRVMRQSCSAYSLSLKYLSSLKPYALRFITFILLFIPSTLAVEI